MQRSVSRRIIPVLFVVITALPAFAAPARRDSVNPGFLERVQRIVRDVVKALEDFKTNLPNGVLPPPPPTT